MNHLKSAAFVLVLVGMPVAAAEKHDKAAQEFKFEGIGFEATLAQFKEKYPDATLDKKATNETLDIVVLDLKQVPSAQLAEYTFFEEKLLSIKVFYTADDFKKNGGLELFFHTLKERFGEWDKDSPGLAEGKFQAFWVFPKVNRYIEFLMNNERGIFHVVNSKLAAELLDKKKKHADFGF